MKGILVCHTCGTAQRVDVLPAGSVVECCRCESTLVRHRAYSLHLTAALSLAALVLYIPANVYPILRMDFYGAYSESTVWDGCVSLFRNEQWMVALIVFLASIVVPLCKLLGLLFLVTTAGGGPVYQRACTWIHNVIGVIGPWAMLDVFLVGILVSLVKLGQLATVWPGRGLPIFTAMVVLTMLASASFDPRLIWRERKQYT